jgi:hypothetical protein
VIPQLRQTSVMFDVRFRTADAILPIAAIGRKMDHGGWSRKTHLSVF